MTAPAADVLLVEDNPEDAELALRALAAHGLRESVAVARDGVEAIEHLTQTPHLPRVILLDLKLPRLDGADVLRRVKRDPRWQSIPVVVLTSSREPSDVAECYRLGANSYVVKALEAEAHGATVAAVGTYWLRINQGA